VRDYHLFYLSVQLEAAASAFICSTLPYFLIQHPNKTKAKRAVYTSRDPQAAARSVGLALKETSSCNLYRNDGCPLSLMLDRGVGCLLAWLAGPL
jgi:hypothetical protein